MSNKHLNQAWEIIRANPRMSPGAKLLLVYYADRTNDIKGVCYSDTARAIEWTGLNKATVSRNELELIAAGHLRKTRSTDRRGLRGPDIVALTILGENSETQNAVQAKPGLERKMPRPGPQNASVNKGKPTFNPQERGKRSKRDTQVSERFGTCLPDDWRLPTEWRATAIAKFVISNEQIDREAFKFGTHWSSGRNAIKRDWLKAWLNWLARETKKDGSPAYKLRSDDEFVAVGTEERHNNLPVSSWRAELCRLRDHQEWNERAFGPRPSHHDCEAPHELLVEFAWRAPHQPRLDLTSHDAGGGSRMRASAMPTDRSKVATAESAGIHVNSFIVNHRAPSSKTNSPP